MRADTARALSEHLRCFSFPLNVEALWENRHKQLCLSIVVSFFRGGSKCSLSLVRLAAYCSFLCFYLSCHFSSKMNMHVCMYYYFLLYSFANKLQWKKRHRQNGMWQLRLVYTERQVQWEWLASKEMGSCANTRWVKKNVADWQSIFARKSCQILTDRFLLVMYCFNHKLETVATEMHCNLRPPDVASVMLGFKSPHVKQMISLSIVGRAKE